MLTKKYYDGMQVHDILCECLDDYDTILTILEKFADAPTIDAVERKRGEWQKLPQYEYIMCCSECGWLHDVLHYADKYCPHCGADMREREGE